MKKLTYEVVYNTFKEKGCQLIDTEFINSKTKMQYICSCENISTITWNDFQQGCTCNKCKGNKISKSKIKYTIDIVRDIFKKQGCELLEDNFKTVHSTVDYICECGNKSKIRISHFMNGVRCRPCSTLKRTGENAWNWKNNRYDLKLMQKLRRGHGRSWIKNNMQHDKLYNDFILNPKDYNLDHIIPVAIFRDIVKHYNLDADYIKTIINQKDNLQILLEKDNFTKKAKGSIFEACQYLMLKGVKL